MAITITEALAEVKTIDARISKKHEFILGHLMRQEKMRDPLDKQGGQRVNIEQERQAIRDLEERKLTIRRAIQVANEATMVTVGGSERSLADWLVWRREVAPGMKQRLMQLSQVIQTARNDATRKGVAVVSTGDLANTPNDLIVNIDEKQLAMSVEGLEVILGTLDGQLSLKNATIMVDL